MVDYVPWHKEAKMVLLSDILYISYWLYFALKWYLRVFLSIIWYLVCSIILTGLDKKKTRTEGMKSRVKWSRKHQTENYMSKVHAPIPTSKSFKASTSWASKEIHEPCIWPCTWPCTPSPKFYKEHDHVNDVHTYVCTGSYKVWSKGEHEPKRTTRLCISRTKEKIF